jgi:hypothetical protein
MRGKEASAYLLENYGIRLSAGRLAALRVTGGGPPFQYDGRFPVYSSPGLDGYAVARLGPEVTSTSDDGRAASSKAA